MSRIIFAALMCLASISAISGQEYKYEPMVREGVNWYYVYYKTVTVPGEEERSFSYLYRVNFEGDTVMNGGRTYKKLYMTFVEPHEYVENCEWPVAWFRETDKRVYAVLNEKNPFVQNDKMMTLAGPRIQTEDCDSTGEYLLYDFNDISATYNSNISNSCNLFRSDSDLVIDGHKRVTYDLRAITPRSNDTTYTHYVAEGFGSIHICPNYGNFIFPIHNYLDVHPGSDWTIGLTHITNDKGDILYKTRRYDFKFSSVSDVSATPKAKIKVSQGLVTAESATEGALYLYSISGTLVCEQSGQSQASCSISTSGLAPGIYVAIWRGSSNTVSQKIVVH